MAECDKKRMSAFAMFQANSSIAKDVKGKNDSKLSAKKRKTSDTPSKSQKMAKKLRMSLRKGKGDAKKNAPVKEKNAGKEKKGKSTMSSNGDLSTINEGAAIYVQQKASTSKESKDANVTSQSTDDTADDKPADSLQALFDSTPHTDSAVEAQRYFEWLIHPVKPDNFFKHLFERKPLLLRRHAAFYNEGLFSSKELDRILKENDVQFSRHLDVTSYTDGQRETHNPDGRALAPVIWDYYKNGCSIRMLNPQTYSKAVWKLNSVLTEYFGCLVGANVYLTPAGTQGFAPHYDDIEAFIIQLEGKKHWRLYKPRTDKETLPRFSSGNFTQEEIGEPILDIILEPGDLMYFPRGTIHQANALDDTHSLHITLSTCQKNTWGDLLEKLVPQALKNAMEEDMELRQALPRDYLNYMGIAFSEVNHPKRLEFLHKVSQMVMKLAFYAPVDAAVDQMAVGFIHDSMPPVLSKEEESCSVFGSAATCTDGVVSGIGLLTEDMEIRLLRRGIARLVSDGDHVHVYHTLENARWYHGKQPQFIELPVAAGPAIEHLITSYPEYVTIESLPISDEEYGDKQSDLAQILYEKGIIVTRSPVEPVIDEEADER